MIQKRVGRTACNHATLRTTLGTPDYTGCTSHIEALIMMLLLWDERLVVGSDFDHPFVRAVL